MAVVAGSQLAAVQARLAGEITDTMVYPADIARYCSVYLPVALRNQN